MTTTGATFTAPPVMGTPVPPAPAAKKKIPLLGKLVVGGLAGIFGVSVTFPIDIVKTNLQSSTTFTGPIHCFRTLLARDGVRGLFHGLPPTLVGVIPEKAIKLAVNDFLREILDTDGSGVLPLYKQVIAGGGAGMCQVAATNPLEIVKIRMQTQNRLPAAERMTAIQVVQDLGLRGLYKGTASCLLRDIPYAIIFFPMYSTIRDLGTDKDGHISMPSVVLAGSVAGATAAALVTPADVIKTKQQMRGATYKGTIDCFQQVFAEGGVAALFKGAGPRMMVQAPLFGITLLAFEVQKAYMEAH
ncbi:hypothetical protein H310_01158 [Aphanomyces invadans]|uniref:Mitochondrial carrier protein n=1 Tax=Aphanomyces invadans TaxID=157072 RepID=A0A024URX8_9STRA|nr:hypothetical protein H310_01158 [Aphanomyces invadans]ETW08617.1 hypothetical protein H310_01158 [Aphanomyces invadans]|eukprot:XP_008862422.1 hypothetical protein H310_01158 [Aphanomyces invadans]